MPTGTRMSWPALDAAFAAIRWDWVPPIGLALFDGRHGWEITDGDFSARLRSLTIRDMRRAMADFAVEWVRGGSYEINPAAIPRLFEGAVSAGMLHALLTEAADMIRRMRAP